jgi:DNA-binding response OmpR family regulator
MRDDRRPPADNGRPPDSTACNGSFGLRVLLVADNVESAGCLTMLVRQLGHHVQVAADGPTALREAGASSPDVVLVNLALSGESGGQLVGSLRGLGTEKEPFIIALGASGAETDLWRPDETRADLYLAEPVPADLLCWVLRRFHRVLMPPLPFPRTEDFAGTQG